MSPAKPANKATPVAKKQDDPKVQQQQVTVIQPTRLPYHPALAEQFGVDQQMWRLLCESVFPSAQTIEGIAMAVRYCKVRGLDIMKRPVHVVPVYNAKLKKSVELVWPGIAEYRTTAARTGEYGGCDVIEEGELLEKTFTGKIDKWKDHQKIGFEEVSATLQFREWMRLTVYRIINGVRCSFPGPKVYFEEIYSRISKNAEVPNDRWQKSPLGMLEKCAEAAALRKAFPEEIGGEPTAEEMEGKIVDVEHSQILPAFTAEQIRDQAAQHLQAAAVKSEEIKTEPTETVGTGQASPDADWEAVLDELLPGIEGCTSHNDLTEFLNDNTGLLDTISGKAPQLIRDKLDACIAKKSTSF